MSNDKTARLEGSVNLNLNATFVAHGEELEPGKLTLVVDIMDTENPNARGYIAPVAADGMTLSQRGKEAMIFTATKTMLEDALERLTKAMQERGYGDVISSSGASEFNTKVSA